MFFSDQGDGFTKGLEDFKNARRRARLELMSSWLSGKPTRLLQYDEIRKRLHVLESAAWRLEEIPLASIIGTVGRYTDFSRQLLPLNASDSQRWAKVKQAVERMEGLPPIEVYQVGDIYFILDGHHRASVARELGASHIQAYVRKVQTPIPLSPNDQVEDIIVKAEYVEFLKTSRFLDLIPNVDLTVSVPGSYQKLLEHISVHRYYMGIDEKREIPNEEAAIHWYNTVYLPVVEIIRRFDLLRDFPDRSEADLYLWVMDHRSELEEKLGWKVETSKAASDLLARFSPEIYRVVARTAARIFDAILPDELEFSPPPGSWRQQRENSQGLRNLFQTIIVALPDDEIGWNALYYALTFAQKEGAFLGGLHISALDPRASSPTLVKERFDQRCAAFNVRAEFVVEYGNVTRLLYERSFWADLLVLRLAHPPPFLSFRRLGSGLRTLIRRRKTPILIVPPSANVSFSRVLLAYGGGKNSDEALFVAAYLALKWQIEIFVLVVTRTGIDAEELTRRAKSYLLQRGVGSAQFLVGSGSPAQVILDRCEQFSCDLIITGGYEGGYLREMIFGSTVDRILWKTRLPVLICH